MDFTAQDEKIKQQCCGLVVDCLFKNEDNGYGVIKIEPDGQGRLVTVCGSVSHLVPGEHVQAEGSWQQHPKFGKQFKADSIEYALPSTEAGIQRFLGSGLIEGVGPSLAKRVVSCFGAATLEVMEHEPQRLKEVKGCGPKKRASLMNFCAERKASSHLMQALSEMGIGISQGLRMLKVYKDKALQVLKNDPYRMVGELPHFGFATVDRLALRMGMKHDAPQRIEKGILYLMEQVLSEGTCYLEKESLIERAERLLHCDNGEASVDALIEKGDLIWVHHWVCCPSIYNCEKEIAQLLKQRLQGRQRIRWDKQRLATVLERERLKLATSQLEAVSVALGAPFSVITGGPGVGKTTIVKTLVKVWEAMGLDPQLAAPTGRAAQRLEEASGRKAQTLHRLLKVQPGKGFVHNAQFPLESRNFVVDETSMVDLELFKAFLVALPKGAQVVLVGDADQLPSVGPGRVLADLIKSGALPVSTLKTVFRQAGNSRLVSNSHRLLEGKLPLLPENQGQQLEDFYFVESSNADHTLRSMRKLITERLPLHFDAATMEQLQILSPMRKGPLGTLNLNQILQSWLNPEGRRVHEDQHGELRVGDKVVQMVNNYDVDLYNGDLGEVTGGSQQHLEVRFSGRDVHYEGDGIQDLSLAYAMTIHKAQGSEYPLVIVPISDAHRIMLNIPLLYTALTRAKTMCVFVGSWEVLKTTLERSDHKERVSLLGEFLKTATPDNNP